MWILFAFLVALAMLTPMTICLNIMNLVSDSTLKMMVDFSVYAWVLIGLTNIFWTLWMALKQSNTYDDQIPVLNDIIPKQLNVTGKATQTGSYDGPAFIGDESKFETIARYSNGDPAAIIQNKIGLIGPHLEAEEYWYSKPYLHKHWHEGRHHKLLREFVTKLLEK
jgi:hypothetical protein